MDKKSEVVISRDDFITHRDQVLTGLTTIMRNLSDFYQGFVNQTNNMIHGPDAIDSTAVASLMGGFPSTLTMNMSGKPRKQREKKVKDPNAPKKPLTAFFLFQQTARPIVATDLGEKATPKEVADETQRRWQEMSEEEKQEWKNRYQGERAKYVIEFAKYQKEQAADAPIASEDVEATHDDDDASQDLGEEDHVHAGSQAEASDQEDEDSDEETEDDEEDEPAPPPPPPVVKAAKASKKKANGVAARSPSPSAQLVKQSPIPVPGGEKKETKRKRKDDAAPTSTAATNDPSPKKTKRTPKDPAADKKEPKRKRKSDAA